MLLLLLGGGDPPPPPPPTWTLVSRGRWSPLPVAFPFPFPLPLILLFKELPVHSMIFGFFILFIGR